MKTVVQRDVPDATTTMGSMLIDDQHYCFTLEPSPPILAGTYELIIDWSDRFQRLMPHVLDVPGHVGIRIHWGNWRKDTALCTLIGSTEGPDFVGHSVDQFDKFFIALQDALADGTPQFITYIDSPLNSSSEAVLGQ